MSRVALNDRFCETTKPAEGKQVEHFDTVVQGLSLLVSPGGTKSFYLSYTRPGDGKRARIKIGRYPDISLSRAREKARAGRGEVTEGHDPVAEKRAHETSQTVSTLVDNYISRHASTKRTAAAIARRLRNNISSEIGSLKLSELHRRDITRCIDRIKDRGADVEANRVFEDVRSMIRWARGRGDLDTNIVEGMRKPSEITQRDRVLSSDEIKTIWNALPAAKMRDSTRRIIRLCLVTAQRVGEVSGMMRDELDLSSGIWTIPAARSKNGRQHSIPLSRMALEIIEEQIAASDAQAHRKNRPPSPAVFPAPRGAQAAMNGAAAAKAIKNAEVSRKGLTTILGVKPFTPHDLRRTAATHMEEIGVSPFVISHVLNHASETRGSITSKIYARYDYAKEKREALDRWAERLAGVVVGSADVIGLRGVA